VKSFSLRNLSLLTKFHKLSAVFITVSVLHFSKMLVLMKIAYYRDKQLIRLEGNFEKATFIR